MMPLPWPNVVLIIANIFSLSGDIAVMLTCFLVWMDDAPDTGTTERARISKCNFSVRYIAYLAAANLIASIVGIINGTVSNQLAQPLCEALGAMMSCGIWASWLWTAAIASAFYRYFSRPMTFGDDVWHERLSHVACWGGALALVGVTYATHNRFGASALDNDNGACTFVTPPTDHEFETVSANVLVLGTLFVVLLFNIWAFIGVHLALERSLSLVDRLLVEQHEEPLAPESAAREELSHAAREDGGGVAADAVSGRVFVRVLDDATAAPPPPRRAPQRQRRVALWPTFAAYVGVFLLSQGPGALCNLFPGGVCSGPLSTPVPLMNQTLVYLHGTFNTVVYGFSNKHILTRWLLCSPRRWCLRWQDRRNNRASILQWRVSNMAVGSNEHFRTRHVSIPTGTCRT